MGFLYNPSEFGALLLSLLTAPFTLAVLTLSVPIYLLLVRSEKRQRMDARTESQKRRELAATEAEDHKRRLARVPTLPPIRKRYGRGDRAEDRRST